MNKKTATKAPTNSKALNNDNRLVTYLPDDLLVWVKHEAKSMGMTESTFLRFLILKHRKSA